MKKKEILKLLSLRKDYNKTEILSKFSNYFFPNNVELKEEFEVLKIEQQVAKELHENSGKKIEKMKCNHEVRITYNNIFTSNSRCTLCGKSINGDNCLNGTIYNDVNRNRYYASFPGSYDDEDYGFVQGVEEETTHNYILTILEEYNDEDEVDLVSELKKLNPNDCTIYEKPFKKEYYVLIIGGSNKQYISSDSYITSKPNQISMEIAHYFTGLAKVNVEVIDSTETLSSKIFQEYFPHQYSGSKFVSYNTYEELIKEVNSLVNFCPFDLIIDLSNLNKYEVNNNKISESKINLNLKDLFPCSFVINMEEIKNVSEKEILQILKEKILEFDMAAGYSIDNRNKPKIYSLEKEENAIKKNDEVYGFCDSVKKLALTKKL